MESNVIQKIRRVTICAALAFTVFTALQSPAAVVKFKKIVVPGALSTTATGINDAGVIVGYYYDVSGVVHGFMLSEGTAMTIDNPKGTATFCEGVNSNDQIVGEYTQPNGNNHGFLYDHGTFTDVGTGTISGVFSINDSGVMVGGFLKCGLCQQLGFVFDGTTYTTLDVPGSSFTSATGVNNQGTIAITAANSNATYSAYTYDGTSYTRINPPGYSNSYAGGINNLGDVSITVDKTEGNQEVEYGGVLSGGEFFFFSYENHQKELTRSAGINDHRQVVGDFETTKQISGYAAEMVR
jgi:probable HAF family extracellular repeat protein